MRIIMNPPYNIHLKILDKVIKAAPNAEIINLSPIRCFHDVLWANKDKDICMPAILKRLSSVDEISAKEMSELFGDVDIECGIWHLKDGGFDNLSLQNTLHNKMLQYDSCNKHLVRNQLSGIIVRCDYFGGCKGRKGSNRTNAASISKGIYEYCHYALSMIYKDGYSVENGKFWSENRMPGAGNKIMPVGTPIPSGIKFDTVEEAKNFEAYTKTKFARYIVGTARKIDSDSGKLLPFMPTYTHPWTDEQLYEYFGLTEDEIKEIEQEI